VKPLKIVVHKSFQDTPVQPKQNKTATFNIKCPPSTESQNLSMKSPDISGQIGKGPLYKNEFPPESDATSSKRISASATADRITPEGIRSQSKPKVPGIF